MSGDVQLFLWLHEYKLKALSSVLAGQGSSVEQRMQERLHDLYEELVPPEVRQEIDGRIAAEQAALMAEREAEKKYTAFRVRADGADSFFQLDHRESFLDVAKFLRRHLRDEHGPATAALQNAFAGLEPVTAEQYDRMTALHVEKPGKVTGAFDLDFDKREVSIVDAAAGWKTWSMEDVSAAVYHACRKDSLLPGQYETRFFDRLDGRQTASAGHLSAQQIVFAEEISEVDGLLDFYMEVNFDTDAVFGTRVCTAEKDMCPRDNCQTQNEFIEKAIRFYAGYISGQEAVSYLPPALVSALRATVQDTENRICRLLFKLAVELDMVMNVLAAGMEIPEEPLRSLRGRCVQNVKRTGGSVTLDSAVEYQQGAD